MKRRILFFICLILVLFSITACRKISVSWLDSDGTLLYEEKIPWDQIPQRELPTDNDQWHYLEWKQVQGGKQVTYIANRIAKTKVTWLDADGTFLHSEGVLSGEKVPERQLPEDTNEWHYTEWKVLGGSVDGVTYMAERVANRKVTWKDAEGTAIMEMYVPYGEDIPEQKLPNNTTKWKYTGWSEERNGNHYIYTVERQPQESYFVGNVFQIVVKDLGGTPIATGTGFVFHKDGWFITNSHVMEDGYEATAIFEIKDSKTGESFTSLPITKGFYNHSDKDIFIGKIDNYGKLSGYYKTISFEKEHAIGEKTYSVGYPNSSVSLEVHAGHITGDLSSLYDKLYSGVSYIASDSYIAPGSSGGILVNADLEVIGITTLGLGEGDTFKLGASIEAHNFTVQTGSVYLGGLKDLAVFLHPDEVTFIKFFQSLKNYNNSTKKEDEYGVYYEFVWKTEDTNSSGVRYSREETLRIYDWGWIDYHDMIYWASGDERSIYFYGLYSQDDELDEFCFSMRYEWNSGGWYNISSDKINYSENVYLTLQNYKKESFDGVVTSDNVKYAKERFNAVYKWIYNWIAEYK